MTIAFTISSALKNAVNRGLCIRNSSTMSIRAIPVERARFNSRVAVKREQLNIEHEFDIQLFPQKLSDDFRQQGAIDKR